MWAKRVHQPNSDLLDYNTLFKQTHFFPSLLDAQLGGYHCFCCCCLPCLFSRSHIYAIQLHTNATRKSEKKNREIDTKNVSLDLFLSESEGRWKNNAWKYQKQSSSWLTRWCFWWSAHTHQAIKSFQLKMMILRHQLVRCGMGNGNQPK